MVYRTNYGLNYVTSLLAIKLVLELFQSYPSDEVYADQNRLRNSASSHGRMAVQHLIGGLSLIDYRITLGDDPTYLPYYLLVQMLNVS